MSLHTWRHQGPRKPSSCTTLMLNSHRGKASTGKKIKKSRLWVQTHCRLCLTLCDLVHCGLPGFCVREGVSQARILERIGQYWLPYPSRALYLLLP